jgi:hypothetical protein
LSFGNKEALFGIHVNWGNMKKEVQVIEFMKPLKLFSYWKKMESMMMDQTDSRPIIPEMIIGMKKGILTEAFKDFFNESFVNGSTDNESYPTSEQCNRKQKSYLLILKQRKWRWKAPTKTL